uniref:Acyltransferase 3 domain-containing protein n=1 Tax=Pyramimonas obovata TaxID=1411642 RepID=A0A7S0N1N8_9CHLO|mmetsp:Transcript_16947/g.36851  ORF Transcript_16947/g.36851 Transcript_16947/m.36851 type:complete len:485 (+) Transcript_16947:172-1626(+)
MYGAAGSRPDMASSVPDVIQMEEIAATKVEMSQVESLTPAPPPKKEREMVWDNSKLILTVLVTTGHIIANFKIIPCELTTLHPGTFHCKNLDVAFAFYSWFHMFEMPGFIFISGLFSRSFVKMQGEELVTTKDHLQKNLTKILFVWFTFSFFAFVLDAYNRVHQSYWHHHSKPTPGHLSLQPFLDLRGAFQIAFPNGIANFRVEDREYHVHHVAWYMFSLFLWRLSVPYFKCFRRPILVAFVTAYLAAYVDLNQHLAARTLGYLPFFVVGLCVDKEYVGWLKLPRVQYACTAYLFGMFAVVLLHTRHFYEYVAKVPPQFNGWTDHWQCCLYYFWTTSMTYAFFGFVSMTPLSRTPRLAKNAQSTLYNYLLHYPILMATGWVWDWRTFLRGRDPWIQCVLSLIFALVIMVVTTTTVTIAVGDRFRHKLHLFQWLISPRVEWLFEGSEEVTWENCMGDSSGYCTGHFGLGYVWAAVYARTMGRLFR